jgi:hypothetical protein
VAKMDIRIPRPQDPEQYLVVCCDQYGQGGPMDVDVHYTAKIVEANALQVQLLQLAQAGVKRTVLVAKLLSIGESKG